MNHRSAQIVRALTFVALAVVAGLGLRLCVFADEDEGRLRPVETRRGEVTIFEALAAPPDKTLAVRGWLFYDEKRGMRLCTFRERGNPPECQEPFLDVVGVDRSQINFDRSGRVDDLDLTLYWNDESISMLGTVNGRELTVEQVLQ